MESQTERASRFISVERLGQSLTYIKDKKARLADINDVLRRYNLKEVRFLGNSEDGESELLTVRVDPVRDMVMPVIFTVRMPDKSIGEISVDYPVGGQLAESSIIVALINGKFLVESKWYNHQGKPRTKFLRSAASTESCVPTTFDHSTGRPEMVALPPPLKTAYKLSTKSSMTHLGSPAEDPERTAGNPTIMLLKLQLTESELAEILKSAPPLTKYKLLDREELDAITGFDIPSLAACHLLSKTKL